MPGFHIIINASWEFSSEFQISFEWVWACRQGPTQRGHRGHLGISHVASPGFATIEFVVGRDVGTVPCRFLDWLQGRRGAAPNNTMASLRRLFCRKAIFCVKKHASRAREGGGDGERSKQVVMTPGKRGPRIWAYRPII